ncbi:MAG: DNA gyrase/topoisomerase IV subunit A [Chloroflexota bacterium]
MAATIVDRAIPDARDGMKPVQRRILYCMYVNGYRSNKPTIKSAKIVGQVTGDFHPHGDVAIYQTLARMAQDFTLRYPLIEGQGNMGSIDNDPPAAARYTEARLSALAEVLLADVDQETVPLIPTYLQDPRVTEPLYLTGHLPPVVNPISGVAVAIATNVPPHNLTEVLNAAIALLDKPEMTTRELMRYVQGPDLPTGGHILGQEGIQEYLETGKGRFTMRGTVRLEESPRGQALVITEIPYTTKDKIKGSIADAINQRKIEGIMPEVRDESDEDHGLRIVLTLRKDAEPARVLNALYAHTELQQNYTAQMVFLMGEAGKPAVEPRQVGMLELLLHWNGHQRDVLTKRLQYELKKALERLHIVQGLIIGAANAQQIVRIFQQAANRQEAKLEIQKKYRLSEIQSEVIANMTLAQVTKLDAGRYEEERKSLEARIAELQSILGDPAKLIDLLKSEYRAVKEKFGDARRTAIDREGVVEVTEVLNIIEEKSLQIQLTPDGQLRVTPEGKRRGRKDYPQQASFAASTMDYVLFASNLGQIYALRANDLPETNGKGESIRRILSLGPQERIVAAFASDGFPQDRYLVQFTRNGRVKKSALCEYRSADGSGLSDLKLLEDDQLQTAMISEGDDQYLVLTSDGKALRFLDEEVRVSGRVGQGVQAINLGKGAQLVAAFPVSGRDRRCLATVTSSGLAKKTALEEYPLKGRATSGVQAAGMAPTDTLVGGVAVDGKGEILVWTAGDQLLRLEARAIPTAARDRKGTRLPDLARDDRPEGIAIA